MQDGSGLWLLGYLLNPLCCMASICSFADSPASPLCQRTASGIERDMFAGVLAIDQPALQRRQGGVGGPG